MTGGQDWAAELISTSGGDMSEGLKKPAKLGDVIRTQLSVFSGGRILRVKLETQDSVDFANEELIAKGRWHVEREGEPLSEWSSQFDQECGK